MSAAGVPFVLAPVAAVLLLTVVLRPRPVRHTAPRRLAVIRASLTVGAFAVLTVEVLGALELLTVPAFAVAWLLFLAGAGVAAARRRAVTADDPATASGTDAPPAEAGWRASVTGFWRTASRGERWLAGTVAGLLLVELLVALLAAPNNFDSQTYHLPKVERWVAQGDLSFWATAIHRQVTIPPGAEYLLLHLRLFTGGDALYHLVQWAAGVLCLLAVARVTAQLGGSRRAQLLTVFVLATTPMVTLQATSTQTDLVCAAWVVCAATVALDGLRRRAGFGELLALGAATGLTAVTKTSGLLAVGPLLVLWGLGQLRLAYADRPGVGRRLPVAPTVRTVGASVLILLVAATVVGPFLGRVYAEFGHPLGPERLRESVPMERHDPLSVVVNALRIGHTALDTPLAPLRDASAAAIIGAAGLIGVDPQDRAITFGREVFPVPSWYPAEDRVAFPLAGALVLIGAVAALRRPARISPEAAGALRAYASVVVVAVVLHTAMIKWQPWGNRLILYALAASVPLAGLWLDAVLRRSRRTGDGRSARRPIAATLAVTVLATCALAGVLAVSYGFPRRLVGEGSVFTTSDWESRFMRRPQWAEEYRWAADAVRAAEARRIGLSQRNNDWEYPWWLVLHDADGGPPELLALQSVLDHRPAADPAAMDAIVCTGSRKLCADLVPPGWRFAFRDYVGYALPTDR
ncbi:phospholipid carrier-dependent glycosyltransferase [Micromonospora craniellae]|uniref:Phospholipid carrier-dependent glycosyltransferase n=1 Tax=Micromonospora craniellae TaxID=2294034 RepID=A0A372G069_9ACTN|nr:glycosyltransferase family 39 protein [Micromonospora craniellae]QOC94432.1 phospholipid carrier-dependent glycosyltransferase [Micromonospora craniellae]RFS46156.1 phospholipid carrier-dependent glycosyltransferase [Micromonospora craniellae]